MDEDRSSPREPEASSLLQQLSARLLPAGLDLVEPVSVRAYNDRVDRAHRLPDLGQEDPLAAIIGNTRALWPAFVAAVRERPEALDEEHPLDNFVMRHVDAALRALPVSAEARYSHEPPPRLVAMQALAEVAGLAWRSPAFLSVHPVFGPWIGLRAAVIFDVDGGGVPSVAAARACDACETRCTLGSRAPATGQGALTGWRRLLAARDACPLGAAHRYDDDQIRYHYTKDRSVLAKLIDAAAPQPR